MADVNEAPAEPRIIVQAVTGILLHIQPFKTPDNRLNIGQEWKEWLEDFEDIPKRENSNMIPVGH